MVVLPAGSVNTTTHIAEAGYELGVCLGALERRVVLRREQGAKQCVRPTRRGWSRKQAAEKGQSWRALHRHQTTTTRSPSAGGCASILVLTRTRQVESIQL